MKQKIKSLRWLFIIILSCTVNSLFAQVLLPTEQGSRLSLNGNWKFKYLPGEEIGSDSLFYSLNFNAAKDWHAIKVPGDWEMQGFAEASYGRKLKDGTGLYIRDFTIPEDWNGSDIYINFDGVEYGYEFWINGKYAGSFASAFNRQNFDISSFVKPGEANHIAVKVITHPKGYEFDTNDDWALSGISRSVTLFRLPQEHLKDVVVKTSLSKDAAGINVKVAIEKSNQIKSFKDTQLSGELIDAEGKIVKHFDIPFSAGKDDIYHSVQTISQPHLWTAETPYLYTLRLTLKDGAKIIQSYSEKIGIREISWADGVLKLNGSPIKLRGATHHDLSPVNGRAISDSEIMNDLLMMRRANMNFIRTSHYPPNPRLIKLCDSLGMYVMDEVPYGFGDEHLNDTSYLPLLLERARLTVWRDKNHPSVIIWSVGNENPVTNIGLQVGRYVKRIDGTRPYCFPQTHGVFEKMLAHLPDSLDLLDLHYPLVPELKKLSKTIDHPLVASEYAHALGLDFNDMESIYETMYANPKLVGGAVWEFFDQGLFQRASGNFTKEDSAFYVWKTKDSIYNTSTNEGMDGMVYADRVPQVDYWEARKVYSPVKALDDAFFVKPGEQKLKVQIENRFDFTNLSAVKGQWQLFADTTQIGEGALVLDCKPHEQTTAAIPANLPKKLTANFYYLKLSFKNKDGYQFYEKAYPLVFNKQEDLINRIVKGIKSTFSQSGNQLVSDNLSVTFSQNNIFFKNKNGVQILNGEFFARVGRKPTISQIATETSKRSKVKDTLWSPFILAPQQYRVKTLNAHHVLIDCKYQPDSPADCSLTGNILYTFSDSGMVHVDYNLIPEGAGEATETGISFLIPSDLTEFRWIGKGPYAAYPGKDRLSEFGIYHLNSNDLYFPGNREDVGIALFTDSVGNGFALIADKANIGVEKTQDGILVSHSAAVSGRFNKYQWPENLIHFGEKKPVKGSFTIIPLSSSTEDRTLKSLFGNLHNTAVPYKPFYRSYDE